MAVSFDVMDAGSDTLTSAEEAAILAVLDTAITGELIGRKLRLFKNNFSPDKSSVLAAFTEADFTGYAESAALVWGTVFYDSLGNAALAAPDVQFEATGSAVGNTVYGCYITDDPATRVLKWYKFPNPFTFAATGDAKLITPVWGLSNLAVSLP